MNNYMIKHEEMVKKIIASNYTDDLITLKDYHKSQIEFIQHERLIHLLIMLSIAFILISSYVITSFYTETFLIIIDLILTVLEIFYIFHYYKLENTIQRWYLLYNEICNMIHPLHEFIKQ